MKSDPEGNSRNLKVYVRLKSKKDVVESPVCQAVSSTDLICHEPGQTPIKICTDRVLDTSSSQRDVFEHVMKPVLENSVALRIDTCLVLYGAEASGKSFTLFGYGHDDSRGIIDRCLENIFARNVDGPIHATITEITNEFLHDLGLYYRRHLHSSTESKSSTQVLLSYPGQFQGFLKTALHHRQSSNSSIFISLYIGALSKLTFIEVSSSDRDQMDVIESTLIDVSKSVLRCSTKPSVLRQYFRQTLTFNCQSILISTMDIAELSSAGSAWFLKRITRNVGFPSDDKIDSLLEEIQRLSNTCNTSKSESRQKSNYENLPSAENQKVKIRRPSTSNVYSSRAREKRQMFQSEFQNDFGSSSRSDYFRDNKIKGLQEKLEKVNSDLLKLAAVSLDNESKYFATHQQNTAKIKELEEKVLMKEVEMRQRIDEIEQSHAKAMEQIARENREMVERARREVRLNVLRLESVGSAASDRLSHS